MSINDEDDLTKFLNLNEVKLKLIKDEIRKRTTSTIENLSRDEETFKKNQTKFSPWTIKKRTILLFDHKSKFLQDNIELLPVKYEYKVIKSVLELQTILKKEPHSIIIFYMNEKSADIKKMAEKICNSLPFCISILIFNEEEFLNNAGNKDYIIGRIGYYKLPLDALRLNKLLESISV